jgi:hypothetical protein
VASRAEAVHAAPNQVTRSHQFMRTKLDADEQGFKERQNSTDP